MAQHNKIPASIFFFIIYLTLSSTAFSDMGAISLDLAKISEDAQKAIIMHNGYEEVLILGTEFKSDKSVEILRFIPLPSEPEVTTAENNPFEELNGLLQKRRIYFKQYSKGGGSDLSPVEVRLSKKIGSHDVTVVKVNNAEDFKNWVENFFKQKNVNESIYKQLDNIDLIVNDYVKRGFIYFVFDVVELKEEKRFINPLIMKFKSEKLYYPLKTSNTIGGHGEIEFIFIMPGSFGADFAIELEALQKKLSPKYSSYRDELRAVFGEIYSHRLELSSSVKVYPEDLINIYRDAKNFFALNNVIYLQMLRGYMEYKFDNDLWLDLKKLPPHKLVHIPESLFGYDFEESKKDILDYFTLDELKDYIRAHKEILEHIERNAAE
jgi:hypothetical protein